MMERGNKQGRFPGEWGNEFSYGSVVGTQESIREQWGQQEQSFGDKEVYSRRNLY